MSRLLKDAQTTVESLKEEVKDFCTKRDWDEPHNPKDLAIGAVTEASELLEIFRFCSQEASFDKLKHPETRQEIADELADILCFLLRFAQLYKIDLTEALKEKLKKNAIKYPPP